MAFNINKFKSNLTYGGARTNLFEVQLGFPPGLNVDVGLNQFSEKLSLMCKTASIPSSSVGSVAVPFFGRDVYTAGNREFDPITFSVINDEDFLLRRVFEVWLGAINGHKSNQKNSGVNSSPSSYSVDGLVKQYSQGTGDVNRDVFPIRTYKFVNMFPTDISAIELSWDNTDIEEYSVSFRYDYWQIGPNE